MTRSTEPPAAADPPAAGHPELETWISYHQGALAEEEEELLRDHLTDCPECARLLLDLAAMAAPGAAAAPAGADFERAAAWRALRARLEPPPVRRAPRGTSGLRLAAAACAAAAFLFGLWGQQATRRAGELAARLERLAAPSGAAPVFYLDAVTRAEVGELPVLPAAAAVERVVFLVDPADPRGAEAPYAVAITGPGGRVVWQAEQVPRSPEGTVRLGFPAGFFAPGAYRLEVFGAAAGRRAALAEHAFEVADLTAGGR